MTLACGRQMEQAGDMKTDAGQAWSLQKGKQRLAALEEKKSG